jgi:hypothetical protein
MPAIALVTDETGTPIEIGDRVYDRGGRREGLVSCPLSFISFHFAKKTTGRRNRRNRIPNRRQSHCRPPQCTCHGPLSLTIHSPSGWNRSSLRTNMATSLPTALILSESSPELEAVAGTENWQSMTIGRADTLSSEIL